MNLFLHFRHERVVLELSRPPTISPRPQQLSALWRTPINICRLLLMLRSKKDPGNPLSMRYMYVSLKVHCNLLVDFFHQEIRQFQTWPHSNRTFPTLAPFDRYLLPSRGTVSSDCFRILGLRTQFVQNVQCAGTLGERIIYIVLVCVCACACVGGMWNTPHLYRNVFRVPLWGWWP